MNNLKLDFNEQLKTRVNDKVALNVVEIKPTSPHLSFFKLTADVDIQQVNFPAPATHLIISYDSSHNPDDVLIIAIDPNNTIAELYNGETLELDTIPEVSFLYYKSNEDWIEFRLWCW
jgi:hypothetical protein